MYQTNYNTNFAKGKHLTINDRKEIQKFLSLGYTSTHIANILGKHRSTICREIKRGTVPTRKRNHYKPTLRNNIQNYEPYSVSFHYFADTAQMQRDNKQHLGGAKYKLFANPSILSFIETQILKYKWSPEMISHHINANPEIFKLSVCAKTIYNYIDLGLLKVKNLDLLLKTKRKTKKDRIITRKRKLGKCIELRPDSVNERIEFGHWEADTVVGKNRKSAVFTLVERTTRKGYIIKLKDLRAETSLKALRTLLNKELKKGIIFKTITFDNGSEFASMSKLEKRKIGIYFAHPYSAFERGTNENYNGILRRYIPKGKDFNHFSQSELDRINNIIDNLPRKVLNFKTANFSFANALANEKLLQIA